jgi:glycosyltransferase involved in cell wall biosynthesis
MHILFVDQFSELGGAQQCLLDLLPALFERGWKATLAAPGDGPLARRVVDVGAKFQPIRCGPFGIGRKTLADVLRFAGQLPGLQRQIQHLPGDLIYINGPRLLPAAPSDRPVIFHCHNYLGQSYAAWMARRALARTRATVIGACRFVLDPLRLPPQCAHVVYNGSREFAPAAPGNVFRIGVIGRLAPQKGQAELLRAARHLPPCRIVICGAPLFGDASYPGELRALAAGLPVDWMDWQQDIGPILSRLDLLVVPSTVPEATPRVILEAFAAGVPVLASNTGGIPELIEHGRTGFLLDSLAENSMAEQIRHLMDQPALRAAVAQNGREAWRTRYTIAEYQRRILSIVQSAGASARR